MYAADFRLMSQFYKHLLACTSLPKGEKCNAYQSLIGHVYAKGNEVWATDSIALYRLTDKRMPDLGKGVASNKGYYMLELDGTRITGKPLPPDDQPRIERLLKSYADVLKSAVSAKGNLSSNQGYNPTEAERAFKAFRILGIDAELQICKNVLYVKGCTYNLDVCLEAVVCAKVPNHA